MNREQVISKISEEQGVGSVISFSNIDKDKYIVYSHDMTWIIDFYAGSAIPANIKTKFQYMMENQ